MARRNGTEHMTACGGGWGGGGLGLGELSALGFKSNDATSNFCLKVNDQGMYSCLLVFLHLGEHSMLQCLVIF